MAARSVLGRIRRLGAVRGAGRRRLGLVVLATVMAGAALGATAAQTIISSDTSKEITVTPQVVKLAKGEKVLISGSGFEPNQEIFIGVAAPLEDLKDQGPIFTELNGRVDPPTFQTNDDGAFAVVWDLSRWARKGLGAEGVWSFQVNDASYNLAVSTPIMFCKPDQMEATFCEFLPEEVTPTPTPVR